MRHIVAIVLLFLLMIEGSAWAQPVQTPQLMTQIKWTGTSWFGAPIIHDLGTGIPKLIGTFYSIYVWDKNFTELVKISRNGRIYAPVVCADLEGDGIYEIIYGSTNGEVGAYEWRANTLVLKSGWPAFACDADQCPEVRGLAAGDLDGDGDLEIAVQTFGVGCFVYTVPGSAGNLPLWPTARGNYLHDGRPWPAMQIPIMTTMWTVRIWGRLPPI